MIALCTLIHTLRGTLATRAKRSVNYAPSDTRHRASEAGTHGPADRKSAESLVLHVDVGNFC